MFATLGGVVIVLMALNNMVLPRPLPGYAMLLAFMVFGMPLGFLSVRFMARHQSQRIRTALLQAGYCASCGYTLPRYEPGRAGSSDDGLVRCPECGAWWRPTGGPAAPK